MHTINYEKPPKLPHRPEDQRSRGGRDRGNQQEGPPLRLSVGRHQAPLARALPEGAALGAEPHRKVWNDRWPESVEPLADTFAREPLLGALG